MSNVIGYTHNGTPISPSLLAADWQGAASRTYPGVDTYRDRLLPEGQKIVQLTFEGAPRLYEYFVPYEQFKEVVEKHGYDSAVFGDKWQLAPCIRELSGGEEVAQGKTKAEVYEVKSPIISARGETFANAHLGLGGGTQIYVHSADEIFKNGGLEKVEEHKLTNITRDVDEANKILKQAKKTHADIYGGVVEDYQYRAEDIKLHDISLENAPELIKIPSLFEKTHEAVDTAVKTGEELVHTMTDKAGAWTAAGVGAEVLGEAGAAVDTMIAPSAGTVVGGVVGYIGGEAAVEKTIEVVKETGTEIINSITETGEAMLGKVNETVDSVTDKVDTLANDAAPTV